MAEKGKVIKLKVDPKLKTSTPYKVLQQQTRERTMKNKAIDPTKAWVKKFAGEFHASIAEDVCKDKEYQNVCKVCGERSEIFGAAIFAHCLKNGWPSHCGQQMFLETVETRERKRKEKK